MNRWKKLIVCLLVTVIAAAGLALVQRWMSSLFYGARHMEKLVLRMAFAAVLSFLIVVLASPRMIRFLVRRKLGDRPEFDHPGVNALTRHKSATPTMGGMLIVVAIFVATYIFADISSMYVRMALMVLVWLGLLGGVDDWLKLRASAVSARRRVSAPGQSPDRLAVSESDRAKPTRDGLKMWEKILFQIALAVLMSLFIYSHGVESTYQDFEGRSINAAHSLYFPFRAEPVSLGILAYVIISILVMVGSSNAVNLTDGMDGLAAGCMVFVAGVFLVLSWVAGNHNWANFLHLPFVPQAAELAVICAAMIGACIGFLWFNCLPAQVFMGDTGSLPLGGLIGYIAVVTRQEFMLFIAGGVFVIEALSVLSQVLYFKSTGGGRIFLCSPIHHHFHLRGWAESKVVVRFWLLSALFAAVALATLKLR